MFRRPPTRRALRTRRLRWCLAALVLTFAAPVAAEPVVWQVQPGDALSVLAQRFGVSVEDLQQWNDLDGDRILIGQTLVVSTATPQRRADALDAQLERPEEVRAPRRRARRPEPEPLPDPPPEAANLPPYVVARGDTVSHIARRHGVAVEELVRMNPALARGRLLAGVTIRVPVPEGVHRVEHVVRRGETLGRLAERHRVSIRDLRRWNPSLGRAGLLAGRTIVIWSEVPASVSASIGATNRGRLEHAEPLPPHPGYYIRDRARSHGTLETILWIQDAVQAVQDRHPRSPRIRVHDISLPQGGPMPGHRSHQSGRDVDISLYQRRCPDGVCPMRRMNPEDLDVERTFTLFEHWLVNERVDAIFLDYELQAPLVAEGRRRGYSRAQLARWFQHPHGPSYPLGAVRHFPLHRDHAHVRFVCPDTDDECR